MRSFHILAFDDSIDGTTSVYSSPRFDKLLAMTQALELIVVASQVTGTSPTITVLSQVGPDERNWIDRLPTPEINAASLSTTDPTVTGGKSEPTDFTSGFVRLKLTLGGTTPKARVQLWVTGRGEQVVLR